MSLTPERLAAIRALGDDEMRTVIACDYAIDDLLAELDQVRTSAANTASMLRHAGDRIPLGSPVDPVWLNRAIQCLDQIAGGA